mmetsp:Transcript_3690/g.9927  ORF Transcript_3690/g.9927 Transcript_3690/m.9927 type:complete len:230 (+) Transcript_3690:876-1565(+)
MTGCAGGAGGGCPGCTPSPLSKSLMGSTTADLTCPHRAAAGDAAAPFGAPSPPIAGPCPFTFPFTFGTGAPPSRSAMPIVGMGVPGSAVSFGGGAMGAMAPPLLALFTRTASAACAFCVANERSSLLCRDCVFHSGMGSITLRSRSALPPTLVMTKYSTALCCSSTSLDDACCLKSMPSLVRRSSSAPGCMDILASAVRMICWVCGEDVLKCSKRSLAYPKGGSLAPSL